MVNLFKGFLSVITGIYYANVFILHVIITSTEITPIIETEKGNNVFYCVYFD